MLRTSATSHRTSSGKFEMLSAIENTPLATARTPRRAHSPTCSSVTISTPPILSFECTTCR
jgi:hypothetical protein